VEQRKTGRIQTKKNIQGRKMIIGGFQKFSLIDYPGKICAIIFTQGCNFRCPYCHNPELVNPKLFREPIDENDIFRFLEMRKGKLDAVEITGGEPTLQPDLIEFMRKIKAMGFLIKLDTNGTNPEVVEKIIKNKLVDYIAMDVKAPLEKYEKVVRAKVDKQKIKEAISLIMNSHIDYEFRTTVTKSILTKEDIIDIAKTIKGSKLYVLQKFIHSKILDPSLAKRAKTFSDAELEAIRSEAEKYVKECVIR